MAEKILAGEADLTLMQDRAVAVLGFGAMGSAHALNLRDSGVDVRVGLPEDSRARTRADIEGLTVLTPERAADEADFIAVLVPPHLQADTFGTSVAPHLQDGDAVLFGDGAAVRFGGVRAPDGVDLLMVAPQADGARVRREYTDGRGVPCLVAVGQDASGVGWHLAAAYTAAIGGLRAASLRTTVADEAETRAFGAGIHDGVAALLSAGYETLVRGGYDPELAYLAILHDLKDVVDRIHVDGLAAQTGRPTPAGVPHGGSRLVDAAVRERLDQWLEHLGREEGARRAAGRPEGASTAPSASSGGSPSLEEVGRRVRGLMGWIRA